MAQSSILGGDPAAKAPPGHDIDSLGPSDSSDSGSDVQTSRESIGTDESSLGGFAPAHGSDTDAAGTGERAAAAGKTSVDAADIRPDRVGRAALDEEADLLDDNDPADLLERAEEGEEE